MAQDRPLSISPKGGTLMEAKPSSPRLRVVPLRQLRLHEGCDPGRVTRLREMLRASGVLRNPVVATEHDGCYIVLDGATRTQALLELGIPNTVVQLVAYEKPAVRLERWHHVLIGLEPDLLTKRLRELPGCVLRPCQPEDLATSLEARETVLGIWTLAGGTYSLENARAPQERVRHINRAVGLYRDRVLVRRIADSDVENVLLQYPDLSAILFFPSFEPNDVLHCAMNNLKLPMGITRHVIADRVLGLNVPLDLLANEGALEEKDRWLKNMVQDRIRDNGVRHYEEATWVFNDGH